jgi:hypothetical protein
MLLLAVETKVAFSIFAQLRTFAKISEFFVFAQSFEKTRLNISVFPANLLSRKLRLEISMHIAHGDLTFNCKNNS